MMIDINHFKQMNDNYGHLIGGSVLAVCAQRLKRLMRSDSVLGRYGGEEFTVTVPARSVHEVDLCVEEMLDTADKRMCEAKRAGRS